MNVRNPIRAAGAAAAAAVSLTFFASGAVLAQGSTDTGAPKNGGDAKTGAPKSGGAAETSAPKSGGSVDTTDQFKDVKITLNADEGNLLDTVRALMKSANADFAIDNALKEGKATVHFKDVAFKDALTTLVKVSTIPITYEIKDGVYYFKLRVDPPAETKPVETVAPERPRTQVGRVPLEQISRADALRKLTGPYNTPPPTLYQHSSQPLSHGSSSSFGFSGGGLLQSNGFKFNPDGSVSRTGGGPINIFGLLKGLLGGLR